MDSYELLAYAADQMQRLGVPYLVNGSMATITYGEARFTNDVDIVADLQLSHVDALLAAFPESDYYCSRAAVEEAIRRRSQFNVIHPTSGLKIDFLIPAENPFNRSRFGQRQTVVLDDAGHQARFALPEDTILKKLEQDLRHPRIEIRFSRMNYKIRPRSQSRTSNRRGHPARQ